MDIINKEHIEKTKSGKMSKETNIEKFFTPPKSPQKSDVNRHAKYSENNKTTLSRGMHSNTIEELTKQVVNNFSLPTSKERKC
jgi:hypothetical protein